MSDGPTTMNGPLHTDEVTLDDRAMTASFADPEAAAKAMEQLVAAGIDRSRIAILDHSGDSAAAQTATKPADQGIVARIREAVLPDDSQTGTRAAVRHDDAMLTVRPLPQEVETAVRVLQAAKPTHFDADLERWRNAG